MTNSRTTGQRMFRRLIVALVAGFAGAAMLIGCGGGENGNGDRVAGIEGTGIVSGFGSVYIDGIEFATDSATILFNGRAVGEDALRVGDVVTVAGTIDDQGKAQARRIVFDRVVDGPIARIDVDNGSGELVALGQTVRISANTTFVNTSAAELSSGDLIAVSGVTDGSGRLRATSIEQGPAYQAGSTRIDVEGNVRDLDAGEFRIGDLAVRYDGSAVNETAGALDNGAFVQVFGTQRDGDAPLRADTITVRDQRLGDDGDRVFLESVTTDYNGRDDFRLNGQRVNAADAQRTDSSDTALADGVVASVQGRLNDGVLVADTLAVEPVPSTTLHATLSQVDAKAGMLTLLGVDARVRDDTRYIDESAAADRRLRIGRLTPGDTLRISGYLADSGLIVTRLVRTAASATGTATARGPIDRLERNDGSAVLVVVGAAVRTNDATTDYRNADGDPIDASRFFAEAGPDVSVTASGPENAGQIDTARRVQLIR